MNSVNKQSPATGEKSDQHKASGLSAARMMKAMVLKVQGQPLELQNLPIPIAGDAEVLVKVIACGVCRTDLHILDKELPHPKLPLIPGHEILGMVEQTGSGVSKFKIGDLVGIPWLGYVCGHCRYCQQGKENLCENAKFTGYTMDGGYAEYTLAGQDYCIRLSADLATPHSAPLLCAGLIGYRSYKMIDPEAQNIGLYGFGAAAHILIQVALFQGKSVYAFTRPGDLQAQQFARRLGAVWAGDSTSSPGVILDAAIIFAPDGTLIPKALKDIDKSGSVICGGIHMTDIPAFPYDLLWGERMIKSVANLTRRDGIDFFVMASKIKIHTDISIFALEKANEALDALRKGSIQGAAVLVM